MSAAELRALASELNWHVGQTFTPGHQETFAKAAELLELMAWAIDGWEVHFERNDCGIGTMVQYRLDEPHYGSGDQFFDTLRRAREASKA